MPEQFELGSNKREITPASSWSGISSTQDLRIQVLRFNHALDQAAYGNKQHRFYNKRHENEINKYIIGKIMYGIHFNIARK